MMTNFSDSLTVSDEFLLAQSRTVAVNYSHNTPHTAASNYWRSIRFVGPRQSVENFVLVGIIINSQQFDSTEIFIVLHFQSFIFRLFRLDALIN